MESTQEPTPQQTYASSTPTTPSAKLHQKACGVVVKSSPMVKVGDHNWYVFGSYVEHRLWRKTIRTVAIVLRSQLNFPRRKLSSVQKVLFASIILTIIFIIYYLLKIRTIGKDIEKEKESTPEPTTRQTYSSSTPTTPSTTQPQTTCGIRVNHESEVMIKVGERNSYVIGSYVEHRLQRKMIRTVAIVHRSEIEREKYHCLLNCNGRNFSVAATCSIHPHHFGFDYGEADFFCPIPRNCATPAYMAITYRTQEGDGSLWNIQSFQPVGNQQHRTENFPYDFTVCISVMFDYSNVLQFVQTMEMYRILGVQKVAVYRTSCNNDIQKVLDYYVEQGFVDVIPWTVNNSIRVSRSWKKFVSPGDLEYYGQIVALTDCLYRYMYESRYIALHDLDELIMPSKEDNLKALFAWLEMNYPGNSGFKFENNIFPISLSSDQKLEYTPELFNHVMGENLLPHVYRIPAAPRSSNNAKVIVNPRYNNGRKGTGTESTSKGLTTKQPYSSPTPTTPSAKLPQTACGVPVKNDPMVKVGNLKTYVIGSYVEHRLWRKTIRTVAVVLRSEQVEYYCVLCCDGREFSVAARCDIHYDHFGFEYGAADITCPVPETCTTPAHVAITYQTHEENEFLWNIQSFQPVRNQQPRTENFPYTFTVCISVMFEYSNVLQLVQAMEMFKILGVQKVAIYRTSCDSDIQKFLDYYVGQGFMDIIPWTVPSYINVSRGWQKSVSPGELQYYGQIPALTDCVYRYMYKSQYLALQDLDELILPLKEDNWATLIHQLNLTYPYHAGFEFENNVFPISFSSPERPEYTDLWKNITGVNILPHVYRIPVNPHVFNNIKVIVNPRLVVRPTVHGILESKGGTIRVDSKIARLYHIKHVSEKDFSKEPLIRDNRIWDYADKLIPAVSEIYTVIIKYHWWENQYLQNGNFTGEGKNLSFKTLMLAYKAKNGPAPSYLMAIVKSRAVPRALRASSTARLEPPPLRTHGRQASRLFSVLAPRWWNELSLGVRTAESLAVFKRRLKTRLFVKHLSTSTGPLFGQCLSSWLEGGFGPAHVAEWREVNRNFQLAGMSCSSVVMDDRRIWAQYVDFRCAVICWCLLVASWWCLLMASNMLVFAGAQMCSDALVTFAGWHRFPQCKLKFFKRTFLVALILTVIFILYYLINCSKKHQTACGVLVKSGPMVKVGDSKSYVIGSYLEHRLERKMIRTVAIVLRDEQVEYYCVLCCEGRNISVPATYEIHSDHFDFEYGTANITCPVPETCTTPAYVAITYRTHEGDGSLWNIQSFQPVRNQQPRTENFPYTFTVCISVMYEYSNVLGLVQAMEMFKILGVQKVAIYKTSCEPDIQKILDYYVRQGFVDIIPWTVTSYINVSRGWQKSDSPGELHYYGQIAALNDCLYRYMYESRYLALQDLDEFILPLIEDNWETLIHQLEMTYPHHAGFEFENNVFPFYVSSKQRPEYTDLWNNIPGENVLPHVYRIPDDPNEFNSFKVIVDPRFALSTSHSCGDSTALDADNVRCSSATKHDTHRLQPIFRSAESTTRVKPATLLDLATVRTEPGSMQEDPSL
ncbi:hypothetical protein NFI96_005073 [Prochilodus magdalenae]|nr:hypothetical protein NFI96_005073 [Prochilodus magdalenae]